MNNQPFVPSILETKASAELNIEVEKELNIKDPNKTVANLIEEHEEKENNKRQNQDQDQDKK